MRTEDIGLVSGRPDTRLCDKVSISVEPSLKFENVRALVPELAVLGKRESGGYSRG